MKKLEIKYKYSQLDPKWRYKTLGSFGTIGKYGCLVDSLAMFSSYYGFIETPDTLNEKIKALCNPEGYANGNLYVWGSLSRIHNELIFKDRVKTPDPLTEAQMNQIRDSIDRGHPVIIQIDFIPATSALDQHWMLLYGYDGDDFFVVDSMDGKEKRITDWGISPQKMIWAYILKEGPITVSTPSGECEAITDFLVSVGYTHPEAHLEVIQAIHESDLKLKSGKYILKENCSKEKENLKTEYEKEIDKLNKNHKTEVTRLKSDFRIEKKEAIDNALKKAKGDWKVEELEEKVAGCEKITDSAAYKVAKKISEILEALNIIKKLGEE